MSKPEFMVKLELNGELVEAAESKELFLNVLSLINRGGAGRTGELTGVLPPRIPRGHRKGRRSAGNALGATGVFRKMAEEGYFSEPRTGREAQQFARDKYRVLITTNTVHGRLGELVQTRILQRTRGEDGLYRYLEMASATAPRVIIKKETRIENQKAEVSRTKDGERGPGAQSLLRDLRKKGFFSLPRSSNEARAHVKHQYGRQLSSKETPKALLRLVREELLTRAMSDKGEYLYKATAKKD